MSDLREDVLNVVDYIQYALSKGIMSVETANTIFELLDYTADAWYGQGRKPIIVLSSVLLNTLREATYDKNPDELLEILERYKSARTYINSEEFKDIKIVNIDVVHEKIKELLENA